MSQKITPNEKQRAKLAILKQNFGLSDAELDRCLYFRTDQEEPWIPSDILEAIARLTGGFETISSVYDKVRTETQHLVYAGLVVDREGRSYPRSGVAKIDGETVGGTLFDGDALAENRALSASLQAAGFDPFKAGSVVSIGKLEHGPSRSGTPLDDRQKELQQITDAAELRTKDLRQIHAVAEKKGLIVDKNDRLYRRWLMDNFQLTSSAFVDHETRMTIVAKLNELNDPAEYSFAGLPADLKEDALIA